MELNDISGKIIEFAINVHKELGPGMLEGAYEACLQYELLRAGLKTETQLSYLLNIRASKLTQAIVSMCWLKTP